MNYELGEVYVLFNGTIDRNKLLSRRSVHIEIAIFKNY